MNILKFIKPKKGKSDFSPSYFCLLTFSKVYFLSAGLKTSTKKFDLKFCSIRKIITIKMCREKAFQGRMVGFVPKCRNPVEWNRESLEILAQKFLLLWNKTPCFQKMCGFSCNTGQFLRVHGNFLMPVGVDSFQILLRVECSLI